MPAAGRWAATRRSPRNGTSTGAPAGPVATAATAPRPFGIRHTTRGVSGSRPSRYSSPGPEGPKKPVRGAWCVVSCCDSEHCSPIRNPQSAIRYPWARRVAGCRTPPCCTDTAPPRRTPSPGRTLPGKGLPLGARCSPLPAPRSPLRLSLEPPLPRSPGSRCLCSPAVASPSSPTSSR
jgi:hypothetical protein